MRSGRGSYHHHTPGWRSPPRFRLCHDERPGRSGGCHSQLDGLELAGSALKVNVAKDREESDRDSDEEEDDFDDE